MENCKEMALSRHSRAVACTNSHSVTMIVFQGHAQAEATQSLSNEEVKWVQSSTPAKKVLANDSFYDREKSVFFNGMTAMVLTKCRPHSQKSESMFSGCSIFFPFNFLR